MRASRLQVAISIREGQRNDWLVFTPAAREKVAAWARDTPTPWTTPSPELIEQRLRFHGCAVLLTIVARAVSELPPPVVHYVLNRVVFATTGPSVYGSCGARPDFEDRPWFILLSSGAGTEESMRNLAVHEICHAWHEEEPTPGRVRTGAFLRRDVVDTPLEILRQLDDTTRAGLLLMKGDAARREKRACRLAQSWGFGTANETKKVEESKMATTISIKEKLPDIKELTKELDLHSVDPDLGKSESALRDAEKKLADARQGIAKAEEEVSATSNGVANGGALSELERAVSCRDSLAVLLPVCERVVEEARSNVTVTLTRARELFDKVACERYERLQSVADRLAPILAELRDLERGLDDHVYAVHRRATPTMPQPPTRQLPALQWPSSVEDEAAFASWRRGTAG